MNEPDLMNNKYQLHLAMEEAREVIPAIFKEYETISNRAYQYVESYQNEDCDVLMFVLGSGFSSAKRAVDELRKDDKKVGVVTINVLRPFPSKELIKHFKVPKTVIVCDRQDSYGQWWKYVFRNKGGNAGGRDHYPCNYENLWLRWP